MHKTDIRCENLNFVKIATEPDEQFLSLMNGFWAELSDGKRVTPCQTHE